MAQKYVLGPNAARGLNQLLHGSGGEVSRRQNLEPSLALDSEYVAPFTVQWAASVGDDGGAWIIWLPDSSIVSVEGLSVDPTDDLEDAGGDYPDGWYILDGEALDRDEGGKLYLNVTCGDTKSCEFSSSAGSGDSVVPVVICDAAVDSETGARTVKQFVSSAVVIAGGVSESETVYNADEHSISNLRQFASEASEIDHGHFFYLAGFGRFTPGTGLLPIGTYTAPSTTEIEVDGDESNFAVVCRDGNTSTVDGNTISYRKLKLKGQSASSPFQYVKTTEGLSTSHKLVNCCFYWQGALKTLADFDVSSVVGSGSVYLRGKQEAPSASSPDPEWTWTLGTAEETAPNGGKVLNYKLYDFAQSKVAVDYRTTFLSLEDHTQKAKLTIAKPSGDASVVIDATGDAPKLIMTDGTHTLTIDLGDLPDDCNGNFAIHELKYKDTNGDEQVYHGLFCDDIDLTGIEPEGKTIESVSVSATTLATVITFHYTDGTLTVVSIPNGTKGTKGDPGEDGDTPEITASKNGGATYIFADGERIATVLDGHTPVVTADKVGTTTTIYVDGNPVAQIEDGGVTDWDSITCISGIRFQISNGKLQAVISKTSFHVPNTLDMHPVETEDAETVDICDAKEVEVVTSESYSTGTHQFTNTRRKITVLGDQAATGQTPFTATSIAAE